MFEIEILLVWGWVAGSILFFLFIYY